MREVSPFLVGLVTTVLQVVGFGAVTAGMFLVAVPAGLITAGVSLIIIGWLAGRGDG